ncbi:MAG: hypothetical protein WCY72_09265 [Lysobacteraceae bacterium]
MKKLKVLLLVPLVIIILGGLSTTARAGFFGEATKFFSTMNNFVDDFTGEEGQHSSRLLETTTSSMLSNAIPQLCDEVGCISEEAHDRIRKRGESISLSTAVSNQVMALFENQPRIDVIAHLADEWVPGYKESRSVYASGFTDLKESGVQPLWNFMRNIAYLGFVVIMIVIGFMIMFRHKIGGQLMVTVGNTLPRVVVSLVLVTFSFAIMGLILDFSGVLMRLIYGVMGGIRIDEIGGLLVGTLGVIGTGGLGVGSIAAGLLFFLSAPAGFVTLAVGIIVIGLIIWGAIKLWFSLIKAYFGLLINVITAPVILMVSALPGNNTAMVNLFKSAIRNALVFPVAFAIVNLPHFLAYLNEGGTTISLGFPDTIFSVFGGTSSTPIELSNFFFALARVAALYLAAETPQFMKAIIPATASKSGADVGAAIQGGLSKIPLIGGLMGK